MSERQIIKGIKGYHLIIVQLFFPIIAMGQNLWSIDQCIDTALENNLAIHKMQITKQMATVDLRNSKQNVLPSLTGYAGHGYNWGQTIDLFTNQFATDRVQFDNFYLTSSVLLFQGLRNYYQIQSSSISLEQSDLDAEIIERNIRIDVSAAFFQVLLNQSTVDLYKKNVEWSQLLVDRAAKYIESEQKTIAEKMEFETQLAQDNYSLLKAQNDLKVSYTLLQNLMNRPSSSEININSDFLFETFTGSMLAADSLINRLPEIIKLELGIKKQYYLVKSIKGRYYPSLSLNGSIGTGYSGNNKIVSPDGQINQKSFGDQLGQNLYQSASLTLSIPIFNKNATRNQVVSNELKMKLMNIERDEQKIAIRNKLEQLAIEIDNLDNQLEFLKVSKGLAEINLSYMSVRFESGDANFYQLTEARNNLSQVESQLNQVNYQLQLKQIILGYYFSK